MKSFAVLALIAYLAHAEEKPKLRRVSKDAPCRVTPAVKPVTNPGPALKEVDVPDSWLWNDIRGANLLTTIRQQHIP